jgi:tetratricopeptide (TPR) repeat protein
VPKLRSTGVLAVLLLVSTVVTRAGERPWTEVRSPNFRVLTNGSADDGRRVALQFEQMRAVFIEAFPNMRVDSGAIFTVLAPRDEESMKAMAPSAMKNAPSSVAAFFRRGWDREYVVVRLDKNKPGHNSAAYYDYIDTLLNINFQWLPRWLAVGLAEFYGNVRFEEDQVYVGAPHPRASLLRRSTLIKLEDLISENPWQKYGNDEQRMAMYDAESWALVHYLFFGEGMDQGEKLNKFYRAILRREDQKKAFQEAFGSFDAVEKGVIAYANRFKFPSYSIKNPPQIHEKDFPSRITTEAETDAELGAFRCFARDWQDARQSIDDALREDPNLPLAHETLGFIDFADGKDQEAADELTKAIAADPHLYLSRFYKAMISAHRPTGQLDQSALRTAMYGVISINPKFAPAYVELALAMARHGDFNDALTAAQRAESLEPHRAGYHTLTASILIALGRNDEAIQEISFVVDRFRAFDHDEAVALWNRIPRHVRPADKEVVENGLATTQATQGFLVSVTCGDKDSDTKVVLQNSAGTQAFRAAAVRRVRYSDTLFWGFDHYSCHHLEGMRATVRYKPDTIKNGEGEWIALDLWQDFPPAQTAAVATPQSPPASN